MYIGRDKFPDKEHLGEKESKRDGYPSLAAFVAHDPDNETLLFRKFKYLGIRNLYYLQSEIMSLENKLFKFDAEAQVTDDMDLKRSARSWDYFRRRADEEAIEGGENKSRMDLLIRELRPKLQEYYETTLRLKSIADLERPNARVVRTFRDWLYGKKRDDYILGDQAQEFLDFEPDLAALRVVTEQDFLSRFLRDHWPFSSEVLNSLDPEDPVRRYHESTIKSTVIIIDAVIAVGLIIGPIVGLYYVDSPGERLGLVAGFTVIFATSVVFLTNARRSEVFAATAAYAAVLVVFVSGNIGNHIGRAA